MSHLTSSSVKKVVRKQPSTLEVVRSGVVVDFAATEAFDEAKTTVTKRTKKVKATTEPTLEPTVEEVAPVPTSEAPLEAVANDEDYQVNSVNLYSRIVSQYPFFACKHGDTKAMVRAINQTRFFNGGSRSNASKSDVFQTEAWGITLSVPTNPQVPRQFARASYTVFIHEKFFLNSSLLNIIASHTLGKILDDSYKLSSNPQTSLFSLERQEINELVSMGYQVITTNTILEVVSTSFPNTLNVFFEHVCEPLYVRDVKSSSTKGFLYLLHNLAKAYTNPSSKEDPFVPSVDMLEDQAKFFSCPEHTELKGDVNDPIYSQQLDFQKVVEAVDKELTVRTLLKKQVFDIILYGSFFRSQEYPVVSLITGLQPTSRQTQGYLLFCKGFDTYIMPEVFELVIKALKWPKVTKFTTYARWMLFVAVAKVLQFILTTIYYNTSKLNAYFDSDTKSFTNQNILYTILGNESFKNFFKGMAIPTVAWW